MDDGQTFDVSELWEDIRISTLVGVVMLELVVGFLTLSGMLGMCFLVGIFILRGDDPVFGEIMMVGIMTVFGGGVVIALIALLAMAIGAAIMGTL